MRELPTGEKYHLLAIGKDAGRMMDVALQHLPGQIKEAISLSKYGHYQSRDSRVLSLEAGHPIPDQNSILHSGRIIRWLKGLDRDSRLIVLLSGGGSALFELPRAGYSLEDIIFMNKELLASGLDIASMNSRRKELSQVKGGGALEVFGGESVRIFALSDVRDDDPRVIASGPFTPEEPDERVIFKVTGNNFSFRELLTKLLTEKGFEAENDAGYLSGSPQELITRVQQRISQGSGIQIWGGELPVTVTGSGIGGRCTHLALSLAPLLKNHPSAIFIALATDGNDNQEGSSGAWIDAHTAGKFEQRRPDIEQILENADSFTALNEIGQIIPTGEYTANVNDIFLLALP